MGLGIGLGIGFGYGRVGAAPVVPPPHSPALWHRADLSIFNASDMPPSNGEAIKDWVNRGSVTATATQATAGQRPTYISNWKNNRPALNCVGASSHRLAASVAWLPNGSPYTLFIIGEVNTDPDATDTNYSWFNINGTQGHRHLTTTIGGTKYVATAGTNQTLAAGVFGFGTNPAYLMWQDEGNTSADAMRFFANGSEKTVTGSRPDSSAITGYELPGFNSVSFDGIFAEAIGYVGALTDPQIADVFSYITGWYGAF